ncbi:MAG: ATP-grasp domain-containing protein, partial [Thermodesulfobacteriota bacterium]
MARIYEYQGKELLRKMGIAVPVGECVDTPAAARKAAATIGKPTVIKAQVFAAGRFKAGGILFAATPQEAERKAGELLGCQIKGLQVSKVLVEEQLNVEREFFCGVTVSNSHRIKGPLLIFGAEGGTSVEEVARRNPERVATLQVEYLAGVAMKDALELLSRVSYDGPPVVAETADDVAQALVRIYEAFVAYDARGIEVNPLVLSRDGRVVAADCHFTIDDNSVFRHPELQILVPRDMDRPPTDLEIRAWSIEEGDYRGTGYFAQMVPEIQGEGWLGFHGVG